MSNQTSDDNAVSIERTLTAEIKLYYDMVPAESRPAPLLIALHGYGAGKWHALREARAIAPPGFAIASLQGPHQHLREPKAPGGPLRFGFGWLTNFRPEESIVMHHLAILDLIDELAIEGIADRERVFLLGFSQSCALNYRFAFTMAESLRGVIGICGGLPSDWETNVTYEQTEAAVFHLSGEHDEYYPMSRVKNYDAQLRKRAHDVSFKSYDAGHEIVQPMREDIRGWLKERSSV